MSFAVTLRHARDVLEDSHLFFGVQITL